MIHREEPRYPGPRGPSTWLFAPIPLPFQTSCSGPGGRERRPKDCPVRLPQLQGGSAVQLTPQPPPGRPRLTNRPAWVRAPMLVHPPCQQKEDEDVGTSAMSRGKSQPLHTETLRHRQKLPKLVMQGVGLDRSPQNRVKLESPRKTSVAQRDQAPCTPQRGLGRPRDWPRPGLKPFAPQVILAAPVPNNLYETASLCSWLPSACRCVGPCPLY